MTISRDRLTEAINMAAAALLGRIPPSVTDDVISAATKYRDSLPPDPVERTIVMWHVEVVHEEHDGINIFAYSTYAIAEGMLAGISRRFGRRGRVTGPHEHKVPT
jgi:hypothetical protein